jgi:hypothetical protein
MRGPRSAPWVLDGTYDMCMQDSWATGPDAPRLCIKAESHWAACTHSQLQPHSTSDFEAPSLLEVDEEHRQTAGTIYSGCAVVTHVHVLPSWSGAVHCMANNNRQGLQVRSRARGLQL